MINVFGYTVIKHGSHDQSTHAGGRRGAGGKGGTSRSSSAGVKELHTAVVDVVEQAYKSGDARMKDVSLSAIQDTKQSQKLLEQGDFSGAKSSADAAAEKLQSLPSMAEDAGLDKSVVDKLTARAEQARAVSTQLAKTDEKLNGLAKKMAEHRIKKPPILYNIPAHKKYVETGRIIVSETADLLYENGANSETTRGFALAELGRRGGG